jgi:uncharacterized protein (TIGR00255 family)
MTGFGRASFELPEKKINIEIKSLNSKTFDLGLRLPSIYREKESEIRNLLAQKLERGKVDLFVNLEEGMKSAITFNRELALEYHEILKNLANDIGQPQTDYMSIILKMPDIFKTDGIVVGEEEWRNFFSGLSAACDDLNNFRLNEGNILQHDLSARSGNILSLLENVSGFESQRLDTVRAKLLKALEEHTDRTKIDANRFEQELIYYLEKFDFTEEKVRLEKHCRYFNETVTEEGSNGRKLGFITQEMGREINTLGSKANHADIQRIVVNMKDELEKIKEQLLNIL